MISSPRPGRRHVLRACRHVLRTCLPLRRTSLVAAVAAVVAIPLALLACSEPDDSDRTVEVEQCTPRSLGAWPTNAERLWNDVDVYEVNRERARATFTAYPDLARSRVCERPLPRAQDPHRSASIAWGKCWNESCAQGSSTTSENTTFGAGHARS